MTMKVKVNTKELKFKIPMIIEPDGEGFYAHSPALPGLLVGGDTKEEALQNARDGAIALLRSMVRDGDPIPLSVIVANSEPAAKVNDRKCYSQEEIKIIIE